ncbi:MAG: AMP-binding protein [Opitutaceae bacterium]
MQESLLNAAFPLNEAQYQMLAHSSEKPAAGFYVEQLVCEAFESVEPDHLKDCFRQLAEECPCLQLRVFRESDTGEMCQQYSLGASVPFRMIDLRLESSDPDDCFSTFLSEDRAQGFPFEQAQSLARVALFLFPDGRSKWVLTFHHIILDGRSLVSILSRLLVYYDGSASSAGFASLEEGSLGFAKFCHAQETPMWDVDEHASFWRKHLEPIHFERAQATERGVDQQLHFKHVFDADFTRELTDFADKHKVSIFLLIEILLGIVITWCLGNTSMCIGSVRSGRRNLPEELRDSIGMLINTVPVPHSVESDQSFLDVMSQALNFRKELGDYERSSVREISSALALSPYQSLFDAVFISENREIVSELNHRLGKEGQRHFELHEFTSLPLVVSIGIEPSIHFNFSYQKNGRYAGFVKTFPERVRQLFECVQASPQKQVANSGLLLEDERAFVDTVSNGIKQDFPKNYRLFQWFESAMAKQPDALAIHAHDGRLSYQDLYQRSSAILNAINTRVEGQGKVIGVLLPRSAGLLACILAISRSGNVYLALDSTAPMGRLRELLGIAEPELVISDSDGHSKVPDEVSTIQLETLCADESSSTSRSQFASEIVDGTCSEIAYVIFTSGSTGRPKLVAIEHEQINNLIHFATTQVLKPEYVALVPFIDNISADSCMSQIFGTLSLGGTLVAIDSFADVMKAPYFDRWTCLGTTPSVLSGMLTQGTLPPGLKFIGLGAEVIPQDLLAGLPECLHLEKVVNYYGPTEATVYCLIAIVWERFGSCIPDQAGRVIGKPIANTRYSLRDEIGRPCLPGNHGELWVEGTCVGRGYLNHVDPERRFRTAESGERRYLTGDRCRLLADGQVEFIGRTDAQVKINGIRFELGEIEARIAVLNVFRQFAVVLSKQNQLTVFYVRSDTVAFDKQQLIRQLGESLSRGLVPTRWLELAEFPLTRTGKVDLKACESMETVGEERVTAEPSTQLESSLLALWETVLKCEVLGVLDNFFELGGDSILAVEFTVVARTELRLSISANELYEYPTVRELADYCESLGSHRTSNFVHQLVDRAGRPGLFLVHGVGGQVIHFRDLARSLDSRFRILGVGFSEDPEMSIYRDYSLEELAGEYAEEMIRSQPAGEFHLFAFSLGGIYAYEVARQLIKRNREVALLCMLETSPLSSLSSKDYIAWKRYYFRRRLMYHICQVVNLSSEEWIDYTKKRYSKMLRYFDSKKVYEEKKLAIGAELQSGKSKVDFFEVLALRYALEPSNLKIDYLSSVAWPVEQLKFWKRYALGGVSVHLVEGERHKELMQAENLESIAKVINKLLDEKLRV